MVLSPISSSARKRALLEHRTYKDTANYLVNYHNPRSKPLLENVLMWSDEEDALLMQSITAKKTETMWRWVTPDNRANEAISQPFRRRSNLVLMIRKLQNDISPYGASIDEASTNIDKWCSLKGAIGVVESSYYGALLEQEKPGWCIRSAVISYGWLQIALCDGSMLTMPILKLSSMTSQVKTCQWTCSCGCVTVIQCKWPLKVPLCPGCHEGYGLHPMLVPRSGFLADVRIFNAKQWSGAFIEYIKSTNLFCSLTTGSS